MRSPHWINLVTVGLARGLAIFALGCQSAAPPPEREPVVIEAGDPGAFIKDTLLDDSLPEARAQMIAESRFSRVLSYRITQRIRNRTRLELLEEQSPKGRGVRPRDGSGAGPGVFKLQVRQDQEFFSRDLPFRLKASTDKRPRRLHFEAVRAREKVVHVSFLPDDGVFSVLFLSEGDDHFGSMLRAEYFALEESWARFDSAEKSVQRAQAKKLRNGGRGEDYFFLFGQGTFWQSRELLLKINPSATYSERLSFREGARLWNEVSKQVAAPIIRTEVRRCPPFSDLTVRCVYPIDGYVKFRTLGETVSVKGLENQGLFNILDSDIFIFRTRIDDMAGVNNEHVDSAIVEHRQEQLNLFAATHELGHFLGLDHPEDPERPKEPTIMGYVRARNQLGEIMTGPTEFDRRSLQSLYSRPANE